MHRHYEPDGRVRVNATRVAVADGGVTVVVWPPDEGVVDVVEFGSRVDQIWGAISDHLDGHLDASLPMIQSAIEGFWGIPDEAPPRAAELLRTGVLQQVNLDAGRRTHELIIHDEGDLIGSHDLVLGLDADLRARSGHFDG